MDDQQAQMTYRSRHVTGASAAWFGNPIAGRWTTAGGFIGVTFGRYAYSAAAKP